VTSFSHRFLRPATLILLVVPFIQAASTVPPVQTAQTDTFNLPSVLPLFEASATGAYMAGQQALKDLRTDEAARYFFDAAQADWDNPVLVDRAFVAFATDGQIGQAASVAKHLLELDPSNELALMVVATEALKERRYAAADSMLARIGMDSFTGITSSMLRAWALIGDNRADEAEFMMEELGKAGLEDFLMFHRAIMAEAAGNTQDAIDRASQAYATDPFVARVVEMYARLLGNAGRFDEAADVIAQFEGEGLTHPLVTAVREAIDAGQYPGPFTANVQSGAAEMYHGIGSALARDGSLDLSLVFLRLGLYLNPSADIITLALGELLAAAGQDEAANDIYDSMPATSPLRPAAVVRIAQGLDAMGQRDEALRRLGNIVATRPDDLGAVSVMGDLLRYDKRWLEAADAYTKSLELTGGDSPNDWHFFYARGIAYERAGEWPKAEADFLRALELSPDQPDVLNYLGYTWIDKDMNYEDGLAMIETAVAAQPGNGFIVDSLGWAFYKLGRIEEAVAALEQAVALLPNEAEINDHLGDAYWMAGRRLEARFQWNVAAAVDEEGAVRARTAIKLDEGLTEATASD
jgi:tetratricopeptide (TPR) repeat protein